MSEAPVIRLLEEQVTNKIAAGEVVERPASVVKELVENALDAGARRIELEVVAGGKKLISVTDDGCGMDRDNALLSFERHATSKIRDVHDIEALSTMGFRGEALAAIASVSRFSLVTRNKESLSATEVLISGGKLQEVEEAGAPVGTRIEVRNLFFNVPARRKFLRTEQTELAQVRQVFQLFLLGYPEIAFRLVADDREWVNLPAQPRLADRIGELYGDDFLNQLRPVDFAQGGLRIHGWVGLPLLTRSDRRDQLVFINRRAASAPVIGYALRQAFHGMVSKDRHPVAFLFLDVPAGEVDVNVHPTKREVRFRHGSQLRDALIQALQVALSGDGEKGNAEESIVEPDLPQSFPRPRVPAPAQQDFRLRTPPSQGNLGYRPPPHPASDPAVLPLPPSDAAAAPRPSAPGGPWRQCRIIGRVDSGFVLLETEDGLVIMDPRAAHERVLYERFLAQADQAKVPVQRLLQPETVELAPRDAGWVRKQLKALQELGFGVDEFGGDTFVVDALPAPFSEAAPASILTDVAHELETGGGRTATESWVRERIAIAACRAAVSARSELSAEALDRLVEDLARTRMPYTNPQGRPTLIFMSLRELRKKFGQI